MSLKKIILKIKVIEKDKHDLLQFKSYKPFFLGRKSQTTTPIISIKNHDQNNFNQNQNLS